MERSDQARRLGHKPCAPAARPDGSLTGVGVGRASQVPSRTIGSLVRCLRVQPSAYVSSGHPSARICKISPVATGGSASATGFVDFVRSGNMPHRNAAARGDFRVAGRLRLHEQLRYRVAGRREYVVSPARPWGSIFPSHSRPGRVQRRVRAAQRLFRRRSLCRASTLAPPGYLRGASRKMMITVGGH